MKKVIAGVLALGAVVAVVASGALAGNNAPSGAGPATSCGFGSCFVPEFSAVGGVVKYKTSGSAATTFGFADCCTAGDKYKVAIRAVGSTSADSYQFTSFGSLNGDCATGSVAHERFAVVPEGAKNVSMTAIALPGGTPAAAYIQMSTAGWVQTAGVDACGF